MRHIFWGLVLVAIGTAPGFAQSLAHPDWHPEGNALILEGSCSGAEDIVRLDLASGDLTTLWDGGAIESYPRWFADGSHIVFHQMDMDRRGAHLFLGDVMDDGRLENVRRISDGPFDIESAPSPDGSTIAFTRPREQGFDVAVLDLDGPGDIRVFSTEESEHFPSWSADGGSLIYHRGSEGVAAQIVLHDISIDAIIELTDGPGPNMAGNLDASGLNLVFASGQSGDQEIYLLSLATLETVRLTDRPGRDGYPKFSPDGTRIAFHRHDDEGVTRIVVMEIATQAEVEYTCAGRVGD